MNVAIKSSAQVPAFPDWEELGTKGPSWKIERDEVQVDSLAPFFPDQNGGVYEQLLFNFPFMLHAMDGSGRLNSVNRQWCKTCGGHLMTAHPAWNLVDVSAATIPDFPYQAGVHVNYQETRLRLTDGLPKMKDVPAEMGGSGVVLPE